MNHQSPETVCRAAVTSEASHKVCSCASVAAASRAAIARTLAGRPHPGRRFTAGVAKTKGYKFDSERHRFVESHQMVTRFANPVRGWERLYLDELHQADTGADFDFLVGATGDHVSRESH